ncbi:MAG: HEPN domain-containing protein [Candidatus Omnitrophica bacterium]|nr:HEPN domain-containing protein [Candidatus Omnitrophota bacterium]
MTYEEFLNEYLAKGLLKQQKPNVTAVEKLILRSEKDLITAKANLDIDEGVAYTVAYMGMLRAGRACMLLKGFRPADGAGHRTVVEFMSKCLGEKYANIVEHFERMRRKRNIFTYEVDIVISRTETEGALETAVKFVSLVKNVIKKENPQQHFKF